MMHNVVTLHLLWMQLQQNVSLRPYNTFDMDVPAEYFYALYGEEDLPQLTEEATQQKRVLGGGSNVLLTAPVAGLVVYNQLKGIAVAKEDNSHVWLEVAGGESWHSLVMHTVAKGLGGMENLALIPGSVGASPIQNIGAYGVEVRETIELVRAWHWEEQRFITLTSNDCGFGYRDSIFKHSLKDKVMVCSVLFRLNKTPELRTTYGAISEALGEMNVAPSVQSVAEAVIRIRQSKLPDPAVLGNAGSFFKNPTIPRAQYEALKESYPQIPSYPVNDDAVKIPAGWLIERCGLKGFRKGDAGVHARQALVLVNYGAATGNEIWTLSSEVLEAVKEKFGIELEREVQVW